ncbi:MAG: M28 family peptidase [bacterium]
MKKHVEVLADELSPRDASHPENLKKAGEYIRSELIRSGGSVKELSYGIGGNGYSLSMAYFGPKSGERIVVGAHYDSAKGSPGADDNASGIAGLLELAGILGSGDLPLQVELVAYPIEEPPYFRTEVMGSAVHASLLREQKARVRFMISLESIGYFTDDPYTQSFPTSILRFIYPSKGDFIAVIGRFRDAFPVRKIKKALRAAGSLPAYSFNGWSIIPGVDLSDHRSYWKAGYSAVMVTDTAFYRNENYHTSKDTPDTLDYERMAKVVEGIYYAVIDQK